MNTINYTHIQVADNGVGKYINPYSQKSRVFNRFGGFDGIPDSKTWKDWQSQYSHITLTCLDADGNFVKPGRYSVEDFGAELWEYKYPDSDWQQIKDMNVTTARYNGYSDFKGWNEEAGKETRIALYLKAHEVKEEKEDLFKWDVFEPLLKKYGVSSYDVRINNAIVEYINRTNATPPTEIPAIATSEGILQSAMEHASVACKSVRGKIRKEAAVLSTIQDFEAGANHLIQQGWKSKDEVEQLVAKILDSVSNGVTPHIENFKGMIYK